MKRESLPMQITMLYILELSAEFFLHVLKWILAKKRNATSDVSEDNTPDSGGTSHPMTI